MTTFPQDSGIPADIQTGRSGETIGGPPRGGYPMGPRRVSRRERCLALRAEPLSAVAEKSATKKWSLYTDPLSVLKTRDEGRFSTFPRLPCSSTDVPLVDLHCVKLFQVVRHGRHQIRLEGKCSQGVHHLKTKIQELSAPPI